MASMRLSRNTSYKDFFRAYAVILDGNIVGKLRRGESKTFEIAAGRHELWLKIDWCESPRCQFTVDDDAHLEFRARSNPKKLVTLKDITAGRLSYLMLQREA